MDGSFNLTITRRSARNQYNTLYAGLDGHKESIAVAYLPEEPGTEPIYLGPIGY